MRIGIDARFYGPSGKGLGRYTEKLIEYLEEIDESNDYVVFFRRENFDAYVPKNPRFKKALAHYPWYSFAEQFLFPLCLFRFHLDLVHFPHFNVPIFYPKKFVVTIHDLILLHYPTIRASTRGACLYWVKFAVYRMVIALAIRRACSVITVSHFTKQDIISRYKMARGKVAVTYEAAEERCRLLSPCEERELFLQLRLLRKTSDTAMENTRDILQTYCLYVGNAYPHKNLEVVLDIAPLFPFCQFVLVGKEDYFYTRLKKKARELRLNNVLFAGFRDDRELHTLYRFASCYLFPSLYEGFGLPPLEAMMCGTPVLAARTGPLPEILGTAAAYFDPEEVTSLREMLGRILESTSYRADLIARGYHQAARYSWKRMAQETLALYQASVKNTH